MKRKIIDDYLTASEMKLVEDNIQNLFRGRSWEFVSKLNLNAKSENDFQFLHDYILAARPMYKDADKIPALIMSPYAKSCKKDIEIMRARTNLFIRTRLFPFFRGMGYHQDVADIDIRTIGKHYTLLFYLQDSNGGTQFKEDGKIIKSKRNRAVVFSSDMQHQTFAQTNILFRTNININL